MSSTPASSPTQATDGIVANAVSGFLVFLIALPLCLGISMASGFPPVAGIMTAIVGGVVVSWLGSAELTIKGPAAGLIVIVLGAVTELGAGDPAAGYHKTLAVGVVAAIIQIGFALTRAGVIASIMPPSVVHGMLAAIGVIIIAKQSPVVLGFRGAKGEPLEMLAHLPHYAANANPEVLAIGALALLLLIVVPRITALKRVPPPLIVMLMTIPLGLALHLGETHTYTLGGKTYELGPSYLVQLPGNLLQAVAFPDFSSITSPVSLKYIAMFALVGSIESLLSVIAVDSLDPKKRVSDLNRDLLATGVGNLIASCIGGLPMISEIVRSKANIDAGANSRWSNFFHGSFLLLFVVLLPGLLQQIPLAALAAMLVFTGFRLASPYEFKHAWEIGPDQFLLFVVTCVTTLATDLLIGVATGLALKLLLHAVRSRTLLGLFRNPAGEIEQMGELIRVQVNGPAVFTNVLAFRGLLSTVDPSVGEVIVDVGKSPLVDHTFLEKLHNAAKELPRAKLTVHGLDKLKASGSHPMAARTKREA